MNTNTLLATAFFFLVLITWLLYQATYEGRLTESCVTTGQWTVYERATNRARTDRPTVYEMSWDYTLKCTQPPHIEIIYNADRPTWAQIGDTVKFVPKIIH